MNRPVLFRRPARIEFDEAAHWYDARRPGLGARFTAAVQDVLDSASENPDRHPRVFDEVHEALVHGFPYCVYYRNEADLVLVLAVFHTARDPFVWQSRL
ncbi:type II toxin-antitoxin system RelE/ParE family toxin [Tautonia rosea]|uniref:type II toxin-antitoxin system RelE/ParE family toxin n=1 Tax=Tautonia rosea TaxID=2728037 RepID=UPI001472A902|nr:type II toxin-antitoxin system RelE/ParE family toxin [Tautonia rosea]